MADQSDRWIREAIQTYQAPLIRFAMSIVHDLETARDVVQDTFIRFCEADREKIKLHERAWLFHVCRNRALDIIRRSKKMKAMEHAELDDHPSDLPSPTSLLEHDETQNQLLIQFQKLPKAQQEALTLRLQHGLSYKEISDITGKTVSHVGVLIHEALHTLRRALSDSPSVAKRGVQ